MPSMSIPFWSARAPNGISFVPVLLSQFCSTSHSASASAIFLVLRLLYMRTEKADVRTMTFSRLSETVLRILVQGRRASYCKTCKNLLCDVS